MEYIFKANEGTDIAEIRANSLEEAIGRMERITANNSPKGFEFIGTQPIQMFNLPPEAFNLRAYNKRKYREHRERNGFVVNVNNVKQKKDDRI